MPDQTIGRGFACTYMNNGEEGHGFARRELFIDGTWQPVCDRCNDQYLNNRILEHKQAIARLEQNLIANLIVIGG